MPRLKLVVAVLSVLVVLAIGGGVVWYASVPQSAVEQLAYARKLDDKLQTDAATRGFKDIEADYRKVVEAYERVETRWGKGPQAAEAWHRLAKTQETVANDRAAALATLERLVKDYPGEEDAGAALLEEGRLIRTQAEALKAGMTAEGKPPVLSTAPADPRAAANPRFMTALEKLAEYRKRFAAGKEADGALMEMGRIWEEGIEEPLIRAIETYEQFLKDYPASGHRAEALYRLGRLMERAKADERALALYSELLEKFPTKQPWAAKAQLARGHMLAEKMDRAAEAAEDFHRAGEAAPAGSSMAEEAKQGEQGAREKELKQASESYGKGRYGGRMPADTLLDKALPPAAVFERFARQKLDAQQYDLDVTFTPPTHGEKHAAVTVGWRMAVTGTLSLINRGEEKTELLLMLARGMEVQEVKMDGVVAKSEQAGETWLIHLPAPLKSEAHAVLVFKYAGSFEVPHPDMPIAETRPATRPATASAPATETSPRSPQARVPGTDAFFNPQLALGDFGYGLSGGAWYPITIIGDVFLAKTTFHLPPGVEIAANGALETHDPARGQFVFQTKRPVFGLYFAYGPYRLGEKEVGPVHYYTYLREKNAAKSTAYIAGVADILGHHSAKFGAFPYEKMAIIETPLPPFLGGVGPASMMMLHQGMVDQPDVPTTLLAHELAHQWFGNLVPINMMDPGYSQWLSEGFATYADALYTEKTEGPEALARHMDRYGQLYFQTSLTFRRMKSIKDCPSMASPLYRPVVYEKGAIVLHALRKVMGDEKFFGLLKKWLETYADKPTTVADFRKMAGEAMGEDLSWFFAEWLDGTAYAHWVIKSVDVKDAAVVGPEVPGRATPTAAGSHLAIQVAQPEDLIRMPVDFTVLGDGGQRIVKPNIMVEKFEQTIEFEVPFRPVRKVIMDEGNWVLKRPGQDHTWPVEKAAAAK